MKYIYPLLSGLVAISLFSCQKSRPDTDPWEIEKIKVEAVPLSLTKAQEAFIQQNNTFATRLLTLIQAQEGAKSFFFSPFSIAMDLTMLLAGSDGDGFKELAAVLGYGDNLALVNDYSKQMIEKAPTWDASVQFSLANAFLGNAKYPLKTGYQDLLKNNYQAAFALMDFSQKQDVLDYINGWCKEKTNGLIPSILDNVNPDAVLFLLNAIYFKAKWNAPFDKSETKTSSFIKDTGNTVSLPMMHQVGLKNYAIGKEWKALRLPFGNGAFELQLLLPNEGTTVFELTGTVQKVGWNYFFSQTYGVQVDVKIPRFETTYSEADFAQYIKELGVSGIFKGDCFSAISDEKIYVSQIIHRARIRIDEEGTEATGATVIGMDGATGPDQKPVAFHCNHPFLYAIVENKTGAIFFLGKFEG